MSDDASPTTTLVGLPSIERVRRSRTGRRIFLTLLFIFIGLGVAERFGVRSADVSTSSGGYHLRVVYAAVSRPGLDTPFAIEVSRPGSKLPEQVTLAVDMEYLNLFDKNGGLDPDPTESSADGKYVYWSFATGGRDRLKVSLDAILAMGRQWGRGGKVVLLDNDRPVASVKFHTWVAP